MDWRRQLALSAACVPPLVGVPTAEAEAFPLAWLNATARSIPSDSFTGTCSTTNCTLTLDTALGVLDGDTVTGGFYLNGTLTTLASGTTVIGPLTSTTVTL